MKKVFPYDEISFRASGWMFLFYLGVIKYIKENYIIDNIHLTGSSAGAVSMCSLLFKEDVNYDDIYNDIINILVTQKNIYDGSNKAQELIDKFINEKYICPILFKKNRISVACSKLVYYKFNLHLFPSINNITDLTHILKGATLIPLLCSFKGYFFMNMRLFDSYLINPHPTIKNKCLKITYTHSCVCGCNNLTDIIKPLISLPNYWCLDPPKNIMHDLYKHGYDQAKYFFERKNFILNDKIYNIEYYVNDYKLNNYKIHYKFFIIGCIFYFISNYKLKNLYFWHG